MISRAMERRLALPAQLADDFVEEIRSLGGIEPHAQPIVKLSGSPGSSERCCLRGLECLSRGPVGTHYRSADSLFGEARRRGQVEALDRFCLVTALDAVGPLPDGVDLFLNLHASTLEADPGLAELIGRRASASGIGLERVVIEVMETEPMVRAAAFQVAVHRLRRSGVRVALDDIGQGHSTNRMILAVRPDFIKLDRFLVRGVHSDVHRRALVAGYQELARGLGIEAVAEGVESQAQRSVLEELGVSLGQGFLFAHPVPMARLFDGALLDLACFEGPAPERGGA